MYEFVILSQLMHGAAHGYLIAKIINDMIGPYARLSPGRLYPLLAKLEQNGLIVATTSAPSGQQSDRHMRVYAITEAGRLRFQLLMKDTSANQGEYQKLFAQKVCSFRFISLAERLYLIDHYINYCQAHSFHLRAEAEDMLRQASRFHEGRDGYLRWSTSEFERVVNVILHSAEQWQHELEWAKGLRERENSLGEETEETPEQATEGTQV